MSESLLFSPLDWAGTTLKNRMALAPLTRGRAGSNRVPNKIMGDYYTQRAGAGLIFTEATSISPESIGWIDSPGIYTQEMVTGWRSITERVHQAGSNIILQLWHTGRASHSDFHNGELPFSASAVKIKGDHIHTPQGKKPYETPRPMSKADIARTIEDYRQAAINAKAAGFDGVEIHAANGYLLNQFLDSSSNQRTDEYGGSLENRYRFLGEVVDAVMNVWPKERVGVHLSPNGVYNDMGCKEFRELYLYVAEQLQKAGVGFLHVLDGLAFGFHEQGEAMRLAEFRALFNGLLIGNCGYDKGSAETRLQSKDGDMISFGRPWITNPDLPARYKNNYPLRPHDDMSQWYGGGAEGYSDYSAYEEQRGKEQIRELSDHQVQA